MPLHLLLVSMWQNACVSNTSYGVITPYQWHHVYLAHPSNCHLLLLGTGKTTSARVLSTQAAVPLVYVPLESILSKWYGESEQNLSKIFKSAEALGGCIVFLDELDSLATSRGKAGPAYSKLQTLHSNSKTADSKTARQQQQTACPPGHIVAAYRCTCSSTRHRGGK